MAATRLRMTGKPVPGPDRRSTGSRRPALPWFVLLAIVLATLSGAGSRSAGAWHERSRGGPDVLLVTVDTLRADYVDLYGGPVPTPNIDALAADGVMFEVSLAHVPLTLPSHASILTGLDPLSHRVHHNVGFSLEESFTTMAEIFRDAGYRTAAFIGAFPLDSRYGLDQGFEVYDDEMPGRRYEDVSVSDRPGNLVIDSALQWLQRRGNEPWFAWVHLYDPHTPYRPPPPYDRRHADDPYGGEVAFADAQLGRLFDFLRSRGDFEDTYIAFTADHGEGLGDHDELTHGSFTYHSTLWVPTILRHPATLPGGVSVEPRIRHVDLMPTILDSVRLPIPEEIDGESLLRMINDPEGWEPKIMYFESLALTLNYDWASPRGIYVGDLKFIDLPVTELYDIESDFQETRNLWKSWPEQAVAMRTRWERFLEGRLPGGEVAVDPYPVDEATMEKLRALGYVGGAQRTTISADSQFTEADDPKNLIQFVNQLDRATDLMIDGQRKRAIAMFRELLDQRKDLPMAYVHLGTAYHESGRLEAAIEVLDEGYRRGVRHRSLMVRFGRYLFEAGALGRCESILEETIQLYPSELDARIVLGMTYFRKGQADRAITLFQELLRNDPSLVEARVNLATVYLEQERYGTAEKHLRRALELDPESAEAYNGLGVVHASTGRPDEAIRLWKRAVELDPELYDTLFNLGVLLTRQNRFDDAEEYLQRFVDTAPPDEYGDDIDRVRVLLRRIRTGS